MIFSVFFSLLLFPIVSSFIINEVITSDPIKVEIFARDPPSFTVVNDIYLMAFDENMNLVQEIPLLNLAGAAFAVGEFNLLGSFNLLLIVTSLCK